MGANVGCHIVIFKLVRVRQDGTVIINFSSTNIACRSMKTSTFSMPVFYKAIFGPYENGPMMACLSQLLHPKSRGTVRLQSTNPYDPPLIDPNYLDDPSDIEAIVR
ncbi:hypothetical protein AVEN_136099-1, partial [Araneus ventricosus]